MPNWKLQPHEPQEKRHPSCTGDDQIPGPSPSATKRAFRPLPACPAESHAREGMGYSENPQMGITLTAYLAKRETLVARYAKERQQNRIPIQIAQGKNTTLCPG